MANSIISSITVPNAAGTAYATYDLKDAWSRDKITNEILPVLEGGMHYVGVTTSAVTHGATVNPVAIVGKQDPVTVTSGDIVTKGNAEFVWDGSAWHEFGDLSMLGAFAYVDVGHVSVTPHGTVSKPTFTGTASSVTVTSAKVTSGDDYNFQVSGSVSQPTFSNGAISGTGTVNVITGISVTTNATSNKTATVAPAASGTATYTPAGEISGTAVTVASKSISVIDGVGSVATLKGEYTAASENLKLNFSGGAVPTKKSVTVGSEGAATVTDPTFSGTGVRLVTGNIPVPSTYTVTPTSADKTVTVTGTATGTVSKPTFTGDKFKFTGTTTAAGSVSQPTFTGTKVKIAGSTTASGSVSQPTFTGTAETWTVDPGPAS